MNPIQHNAKKRKKKLKKKFPKESVETCIEQTNDHTQIMCEIQFLSSFNDFIKDINYFHKRLHLRYMAVF